MQLRSLRFRDQPEKPIDRAVWWVNWVLRNPNPEHILSPVLKLGFIRSNGYDILAIGVFSILFIVYVLKKFVSLFTTKKVVKKNETKLKTK